MEKVGKRQFGRLYEQVQEEMYGLISATVQHLKLPEVLEVCIDY